MLVIKEKLKMAPKPKQNNKLQYPPRKDMEAVLVANGGNAQFISKNSLK